MLLRANFAAGAALFLILSDFTPWGLGEVVGGSGKTTGGPRMVAVSGPHVIGIWFVPLARCFAMGKHMVRLVTGRKKESG